MNDKNGLPKGWARTTLGDVFDWGSGGTPQSTNASFYGGDIPWLVIGDLNDRVVTSSLSTITEEGLQCSSAKWVEKGSVLIAMYGSIGKLGISGIRLTTNQAIAFTNPTPIDVHYLYYYLLWQRPSLASLGQGATQRNISQTIIKAFPFIVAPLLEQRRIVAAIEQQFSRLYAGVAFLRRVQAALKRYRAAVLKAAVEGKLTEAWRAEHPDVEAVADVRRKQLAASALQVQSRRARRLWGAGHVTDAPDEVRCALPNTWELCKVRDLGADPTDVVQVGPMSMKSSEFSEDGVPVLNVGCVRWGGFDLSKLDHLPPSIAARFGLYQLAPGDVVFTRSGTVGRCAIVSADQNGWLMTFHLLRVRADSRVCLPQYLAYVMEGSPHLRKQIDGASIGSTRAGFNTRLLEELDVPLPPLAEQEQIVSEVERQLSVLLELGSTVEASLKRANRLRQSILEYAFSGRLVPQDPKDEPARELLDRLQRRQVLAVAREPARTRR